MACQETLPCAENCLPAICRQLTALIRNLGPDLSASHCAAAIALLAGMATGKQAYVVNDTYLGPAAMAAQLLTAKISQATVLDCAR